MHADFLAVVNNRRARQRQQHLRDKFQLPQVPARQIRDPVLIVIGEEGSADELRIVIPVFVIALEDLDDIVPGVTDGTVQDFLGNRKIKGGMMPWKYSPKTESIVTLISPSK